MRLLFEEVRLLFDEERRETLLLLLVDNIVFS